MWRFACSPQRLLNIKFDSARYHNLEARAGGSLDNMSLGDLEDELLMTLGLVGMKYSRERGVPIGERSKVETRKMIFGTRPCIVELLRQYLNQCIFN